MPFVNRKRKLHTNVSSKKKKKNYTPTYTQNTTGKKNELKFEIIVGKFYFIFGRKESTLLNRN